MELTIELLVYILPITLMLYVEHKKDKEKADKKNEKRISYRDNIEDFIHIKSDTSLDSNKTDCCISYHNEYFGLSFNNETEQILILTDSKKNIYDFNRIINVEIEVDGNTVGSPSIGGAVAGGLLFGGVGAIIGSSKSTVNKKIKNIALKIYVDDLENPYHRLVFLSVVLESGFIKNEIAFPTHHIAVTKAQTKINEWYSRFLNIINKQTKTSKSLSDKPNNSVADKILRLSKLLKDGIISQEDFDTLKMKALEE